MPSQSWLWTRLIRGKVYPNLPRAVGKTTIVSFQGSNNMSVSIRILAMELRADPARFGSPDLVLLDE